MRRLVYSRYGYGRSQPLPAADRPHQRGVDFMHREAIDSLPQLLEKLGIEHPVLLGHSDGASIALIYATTYPGLPPGLIVRAKLGRYHDARTRNRTEACPRISHRHALDHA